MGPGFGFDAFLAFYTIALQDFVYSEASYCNLVLFRNSVWVVISVFISMSPEVLLNEALFLVGIADLIVRLCCC